ncbi:class I SAM-dependent methyltransferase [Alphaproteobacteria bacterium LSUCC0684]
MTENQFFKRVYNSHTHDEIMAIYDDWAASYDETVLSHGYVTPQRCAAALALLEPDRDASILDIGCGTGISGKALHAAGFTRITGSDMNPSMLEKARILDNVYQDLLLVTTENPFDFEPGKFRHMTAMGVIATGHAPASTIRDVLAKLEPEGIFVFSLNDHTLEFKEYPETVDAVTREGIADLVFDEYGDHMPAIGLNSRIIGLKKK